MCGDPTNTHTHIFSRCPISQTNVNELCNVELTSRKTHLQRTRKRIHLLSAAPSASSQHEPSQSQSPSSLIGCSWLYWLIILLHVRFDEALPQQRLPEPIVEQHRDIRRVHGEQSTTIIKCIQCTAAAPAIGGRIVDVQQRIAFESGLYAV